MVRIKETSTTTKTIKTRPPPPTTTTKIRRRTTITIIRTTNKNNNNNGDTNLSVEGFRVDIGVSATWWRDAVMVAMDLAKQWCFRNIIIEKCVLILD